MNDLDYIHTELFEMANRQQDEMKANIQYQQELTNELERTVTEQKLVLAIMIIIAIAGFISIRMALMAIHHLA